VFFALLSMAVLAPVAVLAETVDMLDYQINELMRRRDELRAEIDACKKNTKKFKIAGISTLGATGVGVVSNIALHNKIQNMGAGGASRAGGGAVAEDDCAKSNLCLWERECAAGAYDGLILEWCVSDDLDNPCCEAKGCRCDG